MRHAQRLGLVLAVLVLLPAVADAAALDSMRRCAKIEDDDAARLACFDAAIRLYELGPDPEDPDPAPDPAADVFGDEAWGGRDPEEEYDDTAIIEEVERGVIADEVARVLAVRDAERYRERRLGRRALSLRLQAAGFYGGGGTMLASGIGVAVSSVVLFKLRADAAGLGQATQDAVVPPALPWVTVVSGVVLVMAGGSLIGVGRSREAEADQLGE